MCCDQPTSVPGCSEVGASTPGSAGSFSQPDGRWSDWLFPPGSFGTEPAILAGTPILTMSVAGMIAMKQSPLRNGRPCGRRPQVLRELAAGAHPQPSMW